MAHILRPISPSPSPTESAAVLPPVRPRLVTTSSRSNTASTFALHTHASIASQTNKLKLASSRSHASNERRGSSPISNVPQRSASAYDNGSPRRPPGRQGSATTSLSGTIILTPEARSYFHPRTDEEKEPSVDNDELPSLEEDSESIRDSQESPLMTPTPSRQQTYDDHVAMYSTSSVKGQSEPDSDASKHANESPDVPEARFNSAYSSQPIAFVTFHARISHIHSSLYQRLLGSETNVESISSERGSDHETRADSPVGSDTSELRADLWRARDEENTIWKLQARIQELQNLNKTLEGEKEGRRIDADGQRVNSRAEIGVLPSQIPTLDTETELSKKEPVHQYLRSLNELGDMKSQSRTLEEEHLLGKKDAENEDLKSKSELKFLQRQNKDLKERIANLAGDSDRTRQAASAAAIQFAAQIEEISRDRDAARAEFLNSEELESRIIELEKEIRSRKTEDKRSKIALRNQVKELDEELREQADLTRNIENLQNEVASLKEQSGQRDVDVAVEKRKLEKNIETLRGKVVSLEEECDRTREIASATKKDFVSKINELNHDRDTARAEVLGLQTVQEKSRSGQALAKLQKDLRELTMVIQEAAKHTMNDLPRLEPLKAFAQRTIIGSESSIIHKHLLGLIDVYERRIQVVSSQHTQTRNALAKNDEQLSKVVRELQDKKVAGVLKDSETKLLAKGERECLESDLEEERRNRKLLERKLESWKTKAEEMYKPDLERKYRELQSDLTAALYEKARQKERLDTYVRRARYWEDQYKFTKVRAEKEVAGFENIIKLQKDEMVLYVREYHDKTMDDKHWNLRDLQEALRTLEHDHKQTLRQFDIVKTEKAQFQDKLAKLQDIIDTLKDENRNINELWARSGQTYDLTQASKVSRNKTNDEKTSEAQPSCPRDSRIPHYLHLTAVAEREARVAELRELRKMQRERKDLPEAALEAILEKVRNWHMGGKEYTDKGLLKYQGQSSWEIWQGDHWLNTCEVSKEDQDRVAMLRQQGLILPNGDEKAGEGGSVVSIRPNQGVLE